MNNKTSSKPLHIHDRAFKAAMSDVRVEALARAHMFTQFQLLDFNRIPDETIRTHRWSGLLETVFKHIHARDMMACLEGVKELVRYLAKSEADDYVLTMLHYVVKRAQIEDRDAFYRFLKENLPEPVEKTAMATLAQQFREEGLQQGLRQGMQQGEHAILLRLLKRKFNTIPGRYLILLEQADEEMLLTWAERLIEAQTLKEVFSSN